MKKLLISFVAMLSIVQLVNSQTSTFPTGAGTDDGRVITTGNPGPNTGGAAEIRGGSTAIPGYGGAVLVEAGSTSNGGGGGNVTIKSGSNTGNGYSGEITIQTGNVSATNGGNIGNLTLKTGSGNSSIAPGNIILAPGSGSTSGYVRIDGNVGIGCTSRPSVKLAVNGKIQATEVEIKTSPCSDYVFEEAYKLMPLTELEKYVAANKHLPEVPSAKEFAQNGYNVGTMDDLLLRKVEELTLYIIDLEKRLKNVESK